MKMERFSCRENVLLGLVTQRSIESPSSLSRTPFRSSDVDFNDVFGGPPRRFSLHETRYSSEGATDSEEPVSFRSSRSGLSGEKPVFGEESSSSTNRRRYQSNDFFDDIFQGDKSCSSPRRDFLTSSPGSRVLSPLLPKSEPFATSLPAQFSLPATLTKVMDYPTFASSSTYRKKEGTSTGTGYQNTLNSSLSRFSSQAIQQDEFRNDAWQSNRQSPLPHEFYPRNEKSSYTTISTETDVKGNLKDDSKSTEPSTDINQFHFSIYNWADGGVPFVMPLLRDGNSSRSKEKNKLQQCLRSDGINKSGTIVDLLPANACDMDAHSTLANSESLGREGGIDNTSTENRKETCQIVEEEILKKPEAETLDTMQFTVENFLDSTTISNKTSETKPHAQPEISSSEKIDKAVSMVTDEAGKLELKSLRSLLHDEIEGQGTEEIIMKAEGKENLVKTTKVSKSNVGASKNAKKYDGKKNNSNKTELNKASIPGSPTMSGGNLKRSGVRGKVKEFVKIFNQDTSSKHKSDVYCRSQSCRWKGTVYDNEASVSTTEMDADMHFANLDKMTDASFTPKKHHSHMNTTIHPSTGTDNSADQKESSPFSETFPNGSKATNGNIDDSFEENYLIKELPSDQDKLPQTTEDCEAIKSLDAKILQWSNGKKGNIRSLLSTLQYVLWAESGWKPVPLVNIIEGSAVKRAYQKALLYLHPDKLQQKGASSHQKYIAEKVFDVLQEAWDQFNSLGSI